MKIIEKHEYDGEKPIAIIDREEKIPEPYIVAYGYNEVDEDWEHGHYFQTLQDARNFMDVHYYAAHREAGIPQVDFDKICAFLWGISREFERQIFDEKIGFRFELTHDPKSDRTTYRFRPLDGLLPNQED